MNIFTSTRDFTAPPVPATLWPREAPTITGQSIAKAHRTTRHRARLAASWVTGGVIVRPTVKLAATAFQVSVALVSEEIAKAPRPTPVIDTLWNGMTAIERDAFVDRHLGAIWRSVERATA